MSKLITRRAALAALLSAPAIIRPSKAEVDWIDGFPGSYGNAHYPDFRRSQGRWNSGHPLARSLEFAIHFAAEGDYAYGWDFINKIAFWPLAGGVAGAPLSGMVNGKGIKFTRASSGVLKNSVLTPLARRTQIYGTNMLGAMSLIWVGHWPVGQAAANQQSISVGDNGVNGYNVPFDFGISNTMSLYRAGSGGSLYYVGSDTGAGAGSEYTATRLTTLGVSQDGVFPGGSLKFYRRGVYTGPSTLSHDMSGPPTAGTTMTLYVGATGNNAGALYNYLNATTAMIYGYSRVLSEKEFLWTQLDPLWALRVEDTTPAWASYYPGAAATARPRGMMFQ